MNLIGRTLANYKIERELGRGGMAQVFYGRDIKLDRPVAIKIINAQLQGNPDFAKRFVDEARLVASWRHENIIQVYYADNINELYFFAMEYIEGLSLSDLLKQYNNELISHDDVIHIGRSVANALDYAHKKGVVHRDVKPANVMISNDNRIVLADFGLALDMQQGSMGQVFGTPHYISPEQARRSSDAIPQSDLYSLGVMLYEMLTGVVPFDDPSAATLAVQHLTMPPPPPRNLNPDLSVDVENILLKSLEKSAEDRYQTGKELIDALEKALKSSPINTPLIQSDLPPMPAGIAAPPTVAKMSISQKIAISLKEQSHQTKTAKTQAQPASSKQAISHGQKENQKNLSSSVPDTKKDSTNSWLKYGIPVALVIIIGVIAIFILNNNGKDDNSLNVTILPTEVSQATSPLPTNTVPVPTETSIPATNTIIISTETSVPAPTETSVPPTNTVTISTGTPAPTATPLPTVLYPNGQLIEFYYNPNSFVMWNGGPDSFRVSQIVFEAVNSAGRFEGVRWTLYGFNVVEPQKCNTIISSGANTGKCGGINSEIQPNSNESFWLPQNNTTQFRVLWNGEEVGRCEINTDMCAVYVP